MGGNVKRRWGGGDVRALLRITGNDGERMERWRRKVEWPGEYPDMTVMVRVRMSGRREVLRGVLCYFSVT